MDHRDHKLVSMLIVGLIMAAVPDAGFGQKGPVCPLTDSQIEKSDRRLGQNRRLHYD